MTVPSAGALARALIAVGLTTYVVWAANPSHVLAAAAAADPRWIAAAIALVLVDRALMAYRWIVLLCAVSPGTRPPFPAVLRIFFVSTFVGSFLPSLAGDVYRAYRLSRLQVSGTESAASVLMDRALGVLSMVVVAVAAAALTPSVMRVSGVWPTIAVATALCVLGGAVVYSARVASLVTAAAARLLGRTPRRLATGLVDAVRRYARHHREITNVLVSSIAVQVLRVLQTYCLGIALAITVPLWAYFVFVPLIVIVMQIPVTAMGLGTSQLAFTVFFGQVGVTPAGAVALSLLFVGLGLIGNLPGAVMFASGSLRGRNAELGSK